MPLHDTLVLRLLWCRAPDGKDFPGATVWRGVWTIWLRRIHVANACSCPMCGDDPTRLICDGTGLYMPERHACGSGVRQQSGRDPAQRSHHSYERCALVGSGSGKQALRKQLGLLADRVRTASSQRQVGDGASGVGQPGGAGQGRQRSTSGAAITDGDVLAALRASPDELRGLLLLTCCAAGIPYEGLQQHHEVAPALLMQKVAGKAVGVTPGAAHARQVLARFVSSIASESPVCSYVPAAAVEILRAACASHASHFSLIELQSLQKVAPLVASVIALFTEWGAHRFRFQLWQRLWEHLAGVSELCHTGFDAGPIMDEADPVSAPSWHSDACLQTGVCSGLRRVRERHPCEIDVGPTAARLEATACRHEFTLRRKTTGGLFSWFCPHGICYGFYIMKGAEGRDEVYSYLVQHFKRAPEVIVYDFACALESFCLNRSPSFFARTRFVVDRFHWYNHVGCAYSYDMGMYPDLDGLNSQAAEQSNSRINNLKAMASSMRQDTYMSTLRFFFSCDNAEKAKKWQQVKDHLSSL